MYEILYSATAANMEIGSKLKNGSLCSS